MAVDEHLAYKDLVCEALVREDLIREDLVREELVDEELVREEFVPDDLVNGSTSCRQIFTWEMICGSSLTLKKSFCLKAEGIHTS